MTRDPTQDQRAVRDTLRATVFGTLTDSQLDDIVAISEIRHVQAGSTLCIEHEFSQEVFVVASGCVAVVRGGVEVARGGPGELVGDWALFGDGRRAATVQALTGVVAVVIDPREVDSLLMAVPAVATALGPPRPVETV